MERVAKVCNLLLNPRSRLTGPLLGCSHQVKSNQSSIPRYIRWRVRWMGWVRWRGERRGEKQSSASVMRARQRPSCDCLSLSHLSTTFLVLPHHAVTRRLRTSCAHTRLEKGSSKLCAGKCGLGVRASHASNSYPRSPRLDLQTQSEEWS